MQATVDRGHQVTPASCQAQAAGHSSLPGREPAQRQPAEAWVTGPETLVRPPPGCRWGHCAWLPPAGPRTAVPRAIRWAVVWFGSPFGEGESRKHEKARLGLALPLRGGPHLRPQDCPRTSGQLGGFPELGLSPLPCPWGTGHASGRERGTEAGLGICPSGGPSVVGPGYRHRSKPPRGLTPPPPPSARPVSQSPCGRQLPPWWICEGAGLPGSQTRNGTKTKAGTLGNLTSPDLSWP